MFDTICRSGLVVAGEQFLPLNYLTWRLSWMNLKLRRATASFFFPLPTAVVPLFAGARSPVPVPTDATVQSFTPNAGHRSTRRRRCPSSGGLPTRRQPQSAVTEQQWTNTCDGGKTHRPQANEKDYPKKKK